MDAATQQKESRAVDILLNGKGPNNIVKDRVEIADACSCAGLLPIDYGWTSVGKMRKRVIKAAFDRVRLDPAFDRSCLKGSLRFWTRHSQQHF